MLWMIKYSTNVHKLRVNIIKLDSFTLHHCLMPSSEIELWEYFGRVLVLTQYWWVPVSNIKYSNGNNNNYNYNKWYYPQNQNFVVWFILTIFVSFFTVFLYFYQVTIKLIIEVRNAQNDKWWPRPIWLISSISISVIFNFSKFEFFISIISFSL